MSSRGRAPTPSLQEPNRPKDFLPKRSPLATKPLK
uniref:Uncharacterized protein n=1 Tax=Nelumbo nucifera TaxID=4432 RepID=A0A822XMM9_NELNU|nr:TPA_asm: hypothetical protein HUJ06_023093 [Nelumbo nucifera]